MITLDSMTIAIDRRLVEVDERYFQQILLPETKGGGISKMYIKLDGIGINEIEVLDDIVRISVSAKILLGQYKLGINRFTITQVLQAINNISIIKLNSNKLSDYAVHKCDFVTNLHVKDNHDNYYYALNMINNPYYQNKKYKSGFAFVGQQVGRNKYLKFYDKLTEFDRSCNKVFINRVGSQQLEDDFRDVIRVECRAISFNQIKTYANINSNKLDVLLFSNANPIYIAFNEVCRGNNIQKNKSLRFDNITSAKDFNAVVAKIGRKYLLDSCGNDIDRTLEYIKCHLKPVIRQGSNLSREMKKQHMALLDAFTTDMYLSSEVSFMDYINEIKELIEVTHSNNNSI